MLMSRREGAPYADAVEDGGETLIYEGHDASRVRGGPDPTALDQPLAYASGRPTQNALFREAALAYRDGSREAELVKVYEKLLRGMWVFNGVFRLTDCWSEQSRGRSVFKFRLELAPDDTPAPEPALRERSRMIPSAVKLAVLQRDGGQCRICGASDELHFDHDIPYSVGGSSITVENVQILCARHNLEKSDRIQ